MQTLLCYCRAIFSIAFVVFLVACSSNKVPEELQPAELIKFEPQLKFEKVWSDSVGNGQSKIYNRLQPNFFDNKIAVASVNGNIELFNAETGVSILSIETKQYITGGVEFYDNRLFVATEAGNVLAFDATTGDQLWKAQVEGEVLAAPKASGSKVFVQAFNGRLLALNAETGEELWAYQSSMPALTLRGTSSPLVNRNAIIAGFANGKLAAFDSNSGQLLWEYRVATAKGDSDIERLVDIDGALLALNDTVYAVAYQGALVAIDIATGRPIWKQKASSSMGVSAGDSNLYLTSDKGSLIAFAQNGESVNWEQTVLANRQLTLPAVINDYVVVGDYEGYVHVFNNSNGQLLARTQVDGQGIRANLLVANDMVYVFGNGGNIAAYRLAEK